jgi:hypothetical protein
MDLDANRTLIAGALTRIPGGGRAALQTVYRLTSGRGPFSLGRAATAPVKPSIRHYIELDRHFSPAILEPS